MGPSHGAPGLRWFFFGFSGRISRLPYLLGFLFPVFFAAGIVRRLDMLPEDSGEFLFWGFVLVFSAPLWLWSYLAMGVKRLHDINIPGPVVIWLVCPGRVTDCHVGPLSVARNRRCQRPWRRHKPAQRELR